MLERVARRIRRELNRPKWTDFDRLRLGCGHHRLPNWLNIGLPGDIEHDLTKRMPLGDETVRFVFSEHFIEHLMQPEGVALLRECWRVLKPGGVVRLSTPDLETIIAEYHAGRITEWLPDWAPRTPCQMINECHHLWGHQFIYNFAELSSVLAECGFVTVSRERWHESGHAELRGVECRPFHRDLIVEATK